MNTGDGNVRRVPSGALPESASDNRTPHPTDAPQRDLVLVRRLIAREESGWREFVKRYRRLILQRIHAAARELNLTSPRPELVEDICAEVFSLLMAGEMASLRRFSARSRLSTWLAVVVRRTALRALLRAARQPRQPDTSEFDTIPAAADPSERERRRLQRRLGKAISRLSPNDQRLVTMFYRDQQSYEQIASLLQISTNAVGPKLDRVRHRLKNILAALPADDDSCSDPSLNLIS